MSNTRTATYNGFDSCYHKYTDTEGQTYYLLQRPRDAQGNYVPEGRTVTLTYHSSRNYGDWVPTVAEVE